MNKIVTLNALRGNSYSLFRKIPLMINMGVCAFCGEIHRDQLRFLIDS